MQHPLARLPGKLRKDTVLHRGELIALPRRHHFVGMELRWSYIVFLGDAKTSGGAQGGSSCKFIGGVLVASGGIIETKPGS